MNLVPPLAWLSALTRSFSRRPSRPDFCDMGTAFGLDASLAPEVAAAPLAEKKKALRNRSALAQAHGPARRRLSRKCLLRQHDGVDDVDHAVVGNDVGRGDLGVVDRHAAWPWRPSVRLPCTVLTLPALTSLAITLPGTTW